MLTGGQAKALTVPVTVGGQNYDVTTFTGSYNDNTSKFTTTDMPWWGNSTLADQFAAAVGSSLGLYEPTVGGPFFAARLADLGEDFNFDIVVEASFYFEGLGVMQAWPVGLDTGVTYATLSPTAPSAYVPGPLPILGIAAAFGFSRKLRERIKSSTNTVPSSSAS